MVPVPLAGTGHDRPACHSGAGDGAQSHRHRADRGNGDPRRSIAQLSVLRIEQGLGTNGYIEQEFFIQGTANRYTTPSLATGSVIDSGHPYLTRMIVRRPADPKRFNGTVLVEWLNVTNGFDADNLWFFDWEHILREGYAWVGVSAQNVGVARLVSWNPTRYAGFDVTQGGTITGDALSYDIYSQAAQAIRNPIGVDPLGGLKPRLIISTGESQSASFLVHLRQLDQPPGECL